MRASISACMRSQIAHPYGRITMVPRTGPLSASSALATTSWYQRGKSSDCGVSTGAMGGRWYKGPPDGPPGIGDGRPRPASLQGGGHPVLGVVLGDVEGDRQL